MNVGPILTKGELTEALVSAIRELNPTTRVTDRGAYYRIETEKRCVLTKECVERFAKKPVRLTTDLEPVMPSFAGRIHFSDDEVTWSDE